MAPNSESHSKDDNPGSSGADDEPTSAVSSSSTNAEQKEPSLGPACLVVSILSLAVFSSVCAFGSWIVFSDQFPLAEKAVSTQLIPWVESSQLAEDDKRAILLELKGLLPVLQNREIDSTQLLRLRNCLQDNPVLLWGNVQSIVAQGKEAGLSETELTTLDRIDDRLLRMAAERKLSRRDLEFTIQDFSDVRQDGLGLEVRTNLTADEIRLFMKRAEELLESNQVPNEAYDKTPAECFEILVDGSLEVPKE